MGIKTWFLLLLSTHLSRARADCEACVDGHCFSRKTLVRGFHVSDHLAIDRTNNVIYVQLNSNLNSAFYLDDLQIHLIQTLNTTGMAYDQHGQVLYTADPNKGIYKYTRDSNITEIEAEHTYSKHADLMFYQDQLYYTSKNTKGLFIIENGVEKHYTFLDNFTITDLVVTKSNHIYFVADGNVYIYQTSWYHDAELVAKKKFSLSIDKNNNVYFGDAEINAIYKVDGLKTFVEYAAYNTGSVGRFVFDNENNIVFHDKLTGDVVAWKPQYKKCKIHAPHPKYNIDEVSETICENSIQL